MQVFRLTRRKYSAVLSGIGASKSTNRWNSKGTEIIYTSASRALAMAEVLIHLRYCDLPTDYVMLEIFIPDEIIIQKFEEITLPTQWRESPTMGETQEIGNHFIRENHYAVLQVPSAVVPGDSNYLINPNHGDFLKIKIVGREDFPFDKRWKEAVRK